MVVFFDPDRAKANSQESVQGSVRRAQSFAFPKSESLSRSESKKLPSGFGSIGQEMRFGLFKIRLSLSGNTVVSAIFFYLICADRINLRGVEPKNLCAKEGVISGYPYFSRNPGAI